MKLRVKELARILASLPEPQYADRVWHVAYTHFVYTPPSFDTSVLVYDKKYTVLTFRAEVFARGSRRWLEWVLET